MGKENWQPLTNIWESYTESLDEAVSQGYLDDEELATEYVWPQDLSLSDVEQADVKRYVHARMTEILDKIAEDGGINPNFIASYVFRSVLCGCMWQKERAG